MTDKDCIILVFTRTPVTGKVKTRLIPVLGEKKSKELYMSLMDRTLQTCRSSGIRDIELWCHPSIEHPYLADCSERFSVALFEQQGHDLGNRMFFALSRALKNYRYGIIIGCDCPGLSPEILDAAYSRLARGYDVVIGPAADGGYYLIACTHAQKKLFTDIPWGTSTVLAVTRNRIRDMKMKYHEMEELWDIDRPEDLERWIRI